MSSDRHPLLAIALTGALALTAGNASAAGEPAPAEPRKYYVEDIKATMMKHIEATIDDQGVFHMRDDKTGEMLALKFVRSTTRSARSAATSTSPAPTST